jgi:hypothetical protein
MMAILDREDYPDLICWLPHGLGFIIHDKKKFVNIVMSKYFQDSKFTSFTRRLRRWNFKIQTHGHKKSSYFHPMFHRGRRDLCQAMKALPQWRKQNQNNRFAAASSTREGYITAACYHQNAVHNSAGQYIHNSNMPIIGIDEQLKLMTESAFISTGGNSFRVSNSDAIADRMKRTISSYSGLDETLPVPRRTTAIISPTVNTVAQSLFMSKLPPQIPITSLSTSPQLLAAQLRNSLAASPRHAFLGSLLYNQNSYHDLQQQAHDLVRQQISSRNAIGSKNPQFYLGER